MLTLSLPVAPTANNAFTNRKGGKGFGRIKSKKYKEWVKQADKWYLLQGLGRRKGIVGRYVCEMTLPETLTRGDPDGRQKLVLDWLVSRNLVEGDSPKHLRELTIKFGDTGGLMWITVKPEAPIPA